MATKKEIVTVVTGNKEGVLAVAAPAEVLNLKKELTEEQKCKRREYHKKYELTHKEQVKAWHKAYLERKKATKAAAKAK